MILQIAKSEFRLQVRDGRYRWAAATLLALFALALADGVRRQKEYEAIRKAADEDTRAVWLGQSDKDAHMAGHYGTYAFKPGTPLSFFDAGLGQHLGVAVFLEAHRRNTPIHPPARDSSGVHRFGRLDAAGLLQVGLPFLIILLAHSSITGERERGTLRLLASLGVPPRRLAFGKLLGVVAAVALPLLPALAAGLVAVVLAGDLPRAWMSGTAMIAGYGLYLGAFAAIAVAASAWAPSSRLALTALLGLWAGNCLIAPRLTAEMIRFNHPSPTQAQFQDIIREARRGGVDGHDPTDRRIDLMRKEFLAKYQVEKVSDLPFNFSGVAMQVSEESTNAAYSRAYRKLWGFFDLQDRIRDSFGVVFPSIAIGSFSMGLAGTDFEEQIRFEEAVERYRNELIKLLNHDQAYNPKAKEKGYKAGRELWEQVPEFHHDPPGQSASVARQGGKMLILGGWFAASLAALAFASGRYRLH